MTKYKQYYKRMLENNQEIFDEFQEIHEKYVNDTEKYQEEFNSKGAVVMEVIKHWEDKLCTRSEGNGYANFTSNLSEKFMKEIKKNFPMIESIGIVQKKMKPVEKSGHKSDFKLQRIKLRQDFELKKIEL